MVQKVDWIWGDGEWLSWDEAQVHVLTHTLHYGVGVFEGIRCYALTDGDAAIFRLRAHLDRLYNSAKLCSMAIPFSREQLAEACVELVKRNRLFDGCYLRPLAFLDSGQMGLAASNAVRVMIAAWTWGAYLGDDGIRNGIRVKISSFRRPPVDASVPKGKICGQYVMSTLAKRDALADGYDEAIMLDTQGRVCEGTGENVFVVRDGVVFTPPSSDALLSGITRATVIEMLADADIPIREVSLTRDHLVCADEIFFTGTAAEITPVRELERQPVGEGRPGPITKSVRETYGKLVRGESHRSSEYCERAL